MYTLVSQVLKAKAFFYKMQKIGEFEIRLGFEGNYKTYFVVMDGRNRLINGPESIFIFCLVFCFVCFIFCSFKLILIIKGGKNMFLRDGYTVEMLRWTLF